MVAALEFVAVSKIYRGFGARQLQALNDFSLRVEPGEIFGFLGPNGAGKSTAIHLAMGFMRPTSGYGRMLGTPFGNARTRRRVGFLAENVALYHRRAERLVRFYGALSGMGGPSLSKRSREVLELVGLESQSNRNVGKFSRGMLQRTGCAQALVNDPELLILDEPTSALDPLARVAVRELLLHSRAQGKTIFLSSHLLSEVELICDRVAVINRGQVVRLGRTADLLHCADRIKISARHISAQSFEESSEENGVVTFSVPAGSERATLERVWNLGGEIVSVNPLRRSLEDIFVEATSAPVSMDQGMVQ
ncbi:MAG: ABC transporter ATP-binding protein [Acidobacteriales bacterium]|nr:ABC transporter ATP-binding protein [Terriglobales bacterium]